MSFALLATIVVILILILFAFTWKMVSWKADYDQYAATCGRFDDYRRKVDELQNQHSGYGPRDQHIPALDQIITLQLYPKAPDGKGDGHFYIPSADMYKIGYMEVATDSGKSSLKSTERSITLRELLNRLLKDVPVELVYPVDADWKFVDEPPVTPDIFVLFK